MLVNEEQASSEGTSPSSTLLSSHSGWESDNGSGAVTQDLGSSSSATLRSAARSAMVGFRSS
jgi:hypothetical protein